MRFDLAVMAHIFRQSQTGGVQSVVAKDPTDTKQIRLIRQHLEHEAAQFQQGKCGDPATIHGGHMPGLAALQTRSAAIDVEYTALLAGAQITYTTHEPALVQALHEWFAAQVSDHGVHARSRKPYDQLLLPAIYHRCPVQARHAPYRLGLLPGRVCAALARRRGR